MTTNCPMICSMDHGRCHEFCARQEYHKGTCRCERHQRRYEQNRANRQAAKKAAPRLTPEFGSENAVPVQPRNYFLNEKHELLTCPDCDALIGRFEDHDCAGHDPLDILCQGMCQDHHKCCSYFQGVSHSICRCATCHEDEDRRLLKAIESVQTTESRGNPTGPGRVTATPERDEKDELIAELRNEISTLQCERQLEYEGYRRRVEDLEARLDAEVRSNMNMDQVSLSNLHFNWMGRPMIMLEEFVPSEEMVERILKLAKQDKPIYFDIRLRG